MSDVLREGFELGGYRIEATTGSQSTGTVYRATKISNSHTVALHLIADRLAKDHVFRARFHRELDTLSALSNDYLLNVFETGEEVGADEYDPVRLWAAVTPAPGPDLAVVLLHQDKLTPVQAAHLVAQAAEALEAAHGAGVLHRGLEPGSILVDESDRSAHLGGFGLVDDGAVEGGTGDIHRSAYPPSPDYVAPEQIAGKPVDRRADVYALGGVLYFALTGRPPFEGSSIEDILNGHLRGKTPRPSDVVSSVPETLDGVVARALAKNPADRYGSAAELAEDLLVNVGSRRRREPGAPQPIAAPLPPRSTPAEANEPSAPVDVGTAAEKQRVIQAWTDAVSAGGRLWSPSAAGSSVVAAGSAAAPAPDEGDVGKRGDFSQFDEARRRRAEQEGAPVVSEPSEPHERPQPDAGTQPAPRKVEPAQLDENTKPSTKRAPKLVQPAAAAPRRRRDSPSRPTRNAVVGLGAAAVIAALAVGGILLANNSEDDDGGQKQAATPEEPVADALEKAPAAKDKPATRKEPSTARPRIALVGWPDRDGFTAVVYANPSNRATATARARKAATTGVRAGVLRSDDHGSLEAGYWVAFAGVYATAEQAQRTVDRMKREKVAGRPYVRRIGSQP